MRQSSVKHRILVVEDGDSEREALARLLRLEQFEVSTARSAEDAESHLARPVDLVVSDLRMAQRTGIDLLRSWRQRHPHTPFVILTAYGEVGTAVEAMKLGANDFLAKPVDPIRLLHVVRDLLATSATPQSQAADASEATRGLDRIIGRSQVILDACEKTLRAARSNSTVLLLGESGTGKELFAEAIHRHSNRSQGPFVVVNMAAIPDTLVESELFGHVRGAFTGADSARTGRFEAAHGGTLFVDEIGDFPLQLQAKLLRSLETRSVTPVGSGVEKSVDVRVVAATSRPLARMKDQGLFREDLYYRLNVIAIPLPPLRQRRQDIPLLVQHFLAQSPDGSSRAPIEVTPELMRTLESLEWPGNVRQLRNCLDWMRVMARGEKLGVEDLPPDVLPEADQGTPLGGGRIESLERTAILEALDQFGGNRTRAAEFLGISVRTLQRRLREWDADKTTE
jgi:two-component system, NtrC family, response regulator HydG